MRQIGGIENIDSMPPIFVLGEVFDMSLSTTNQKESVAKNSK